MRPLPLYIRLKRFWARFYREGMYYSIIFKYVIMSVIMQLN
jgi:hypothetical protein